MNKPDGRQGNPVDRTLKVWANKWHMVLNSNSNFIVDDTLNLLNMDCRGVVNPRDLGLHGQS